MSDRIAQRPRDIQNKSTGNSPTTITEEAKSSAESASDLFDKGKGKGQGQGQSTPPRSVAFSENRRSSVPPPMTFTVATLSRQNTPGGACLNTDTQAHGRMMPVVIQPFHSWLNEFHAIHQQGSLAGAVAGSVVARTPMTCTRQAMGNNSPVDSKHPRSQASIPIFCIHGRPRRNSTSITPLHLRDRRTLSVSQPCASLSRACYTSGSKTAIGRPRPRGDEECGVGKFPPTRPRAGFQRASTLPEWIMTKTCFTSSDFVGDLNIKWMMQQCPSSVVHYARV
jgi:hypothetical protein